MTQTLTQPKNKPVTERQERLSAYLKELRDCICVAFESIEPSAIFERKPWEYSKGSGGGEMSVLRGDIFEKVAVNCSEIRGPHFPMDDGWGPFFATGISLITHMTNPHAPTVHMNIRYIETEQRWWFGGGFDLTPMGIAYPEDTKHFHDTAKNLLEPHGKDLYPTFSRNAEEYFYIPHRKKQRGVGGIFFDHYYTGNFDNDLMMWKDIGEHFLDTILPIYDRRINMPYSSAERELQLEMRAHYVEFNLLYDRGTKFGFLSGGNPEAILCSMPPLVKW